jgi:TRAP-type C4-dicarboxylate transport system permease large subunit/TRAP-type C4-dicarboxylate transport system permease small subunit
MAGAAPTAKPAPFLRPLDLLDRGILLAESSLCLVVVAMMVLVAVIDAAFGKYISSQSIRAAMGEAPMHATLWAAFLGASFATRGRRHLAIDVLGRLLPDRARRVTVGIAAALGAVVAFALAKGLYETLTEQAHSVAEQMRQNTELGIEGASVDHSYQFHFIMPGGFLLIGIRLLLHSFHEFMASVRGSDLHARPPIEPAPDSERPAHSLTHANEAAPADAPIVDDHDGRYAPVSQAGWLEIAIGVVALVVLVFLTLGSTVFKPAAVLALAAALCLVVPLLLRYRKNNSMVPPVKDDGAPSPPANAKEIIVGVVGVAVVLGLAQFGIAHIKEIPMGWGIGFFVGMALLGAPLFTFIGGLALFIWTHGTSVVDPMPIKDAVEDVLGGHFARMSVLPTIPIFTLAGYLMSESKTPQRLVRLARAFLGFAPGGLAIVCVLASAFFTVFSGASGITIVAIGGLLLPALLKEGYKERFSLGLVTTGGALGITFYPCLPFIVYGIVAGLQEVPPGHERLQLDKFLFAGFGPGMLLIGLLVIYCLIMGSVQKIQRSKFDARDGRCLR